jgi:hypothetical protein
LLLRWFQACRSAACNWLYLDFIHCLDRTWSHQQLPVLQSLLVSLLQVTLPIQDSFFKF